MGSNSQSSQDVHWQAFGHSMGEWGSRNLVLIIALAVILFLLFILISIFGIVSQAALIGAADKLDKDEETGFSKSLSIGITNFWRLLGLMILVGLIAAVPLFFLAAIGLTIFASGVSPAFYAFLIPIGLILIPVFIGSVIRCRSIGSGGSLYTALVSS